MPLDDELQLGIVSQDRSDLLQDGRRLWQDLRRVGGELNFVNHRPSRFGQRSGEIQALWPGFKHANARRFHVRPAVIVPEQNLYVLCGGGLVQGQSVKISELWERKLSRRSETFVGVCWRNLNLNVLGPCRRVFSGEIVNGDVRYLLDLRKSDDDFLGGGGLARPLLAPVLLEQVRYSPGFKVYFPIERKSRNGYVVEIWISTSLAQFELSSRV